MIIRPHILATAASCLIVLTGCAAQPDEPRFRSYDLELIHTSPYSTYIGVAPGSRGAGLPRMGQLDSKGFSEYLRDSIGCSLDRSREIHRLGHKKTPAGYMVPINCL
jgi:hypothetical protein